ncbi:MAG: UvrD-helicase domain-containing protein [Chloroflexi bacterium]|jgi:ATP-dependent exoDNAse (exonuclease V) beta subunit|nr:UvrD-helicase domain-containing protein [Chloroflexota bacterium]MBT4341693.1 UvrD-helicase domain-containing protein [Chloroflexota bacterium]MBT4942527.1 UvrD-helicase domain-containing protein [Chloroflexota bacterium]MBT5253618.1 UvrD-helicase domain-containing protein [Chloroflexota bacterium]MBT7832319.1 UvrD-helicase domain-containing protein [Chloroflexota bacterium]
MNSPHASDVVRDRIVGLADGSLEQTIYAGAGAGTGKTKALVERIANLVLLAGVRPENIAALTFTKAAASELRQRVREELERRQDESVDSAEGMKYAEALDGLDSAFIGTIHSFAQSLLQERPLSVGLPPVFELNDGVQGGARFEEEWSTWLDEALNDETFSDAVIGVQRLGLSQPLRNLKDLALEFHANYDLVERFGELPKPTQTDKPDLILEAVRSDLQLAYDLRSYCTNPDDKLLAHLESVVPQALRWINEVQAADSDEESILAVTQLPKLSVGGGRKDDWNSLESGDSSLKEVRALLKEAQARLKQGRQSLGEATVVPLVNAVSQMVLDYARKRRNEGLLEFQDLLVLSCELLESDDDVRWYFQRRYTHVLIDEFQDTDPLQLKLAMRLTDRMSSSNAAGTPTPGALFVVGDEKQSIYSFRRADLTQLERLISSLHADHLSLVKNYRSNPGILSWVNEIFEPWMNGPEGILPDTNQAEYTALQPGRDDYSTVEKPRVMIAGGLADGNTEVARESEAEDLAKLALSVGAGDWDLPDKSGGMRKSDYRDLCVLMPRRTALSYLEDAFFKHEVPYILEGQAPIFESQTVHELSNNLIAIDDPTDQVAIVAALKSAAWGCSDQDLYEWACADRKFEYARATYDPAKFEIDTGVHRVATALAGLAGYHDTRQMYSTPFLIEKFVRDRRLREIAALSNPNGDRERLIDVIIEMSRSLQRSGNGSLREFVRWVSKQAEASVKVAEGALSNSELNAVRVMTVHAAKGLEFPIVALMGLQVGVSAFKGNSITKEELGQPIIAVRMGSADLGISTADFADRLEVSKKSDSAEQVRLAYVAATRAREHLVVSVHRSGKDKSTLAAKIADLDALNTVSKPFGISSETRSPQTKPDSTPTNAQPFSLDNRKDWFEDLEAVVEQAKYRGYVTPSDLADHTMFAAPKPEDNTESTEWNTTLRGRGGTDVGSAVHRVLQDIDFDDDFNLDELVAQAVLAYNIPDLKKDVVLLVRNVLSSPSVAAATGENSWSEAWVAAEVEEGIEIEGSVDLIVQHEDGTITIIDYKTDRVQGEFLEERARGYKNQLAGYALVLEKMGMKVRSAVLVFANGGVGDTAREYVVDDLEAAKAAALSKIRDKIRSLISD